MRILTLIMMAVMILPLGAQDVEKVAPPVKEAPSKKVVKPIEAEVKADPHAKPSTRNRRRVVLPPAGHKPAQGKPMPQLKRQAVSVTPADPKVLTQNITIQLQGSVNDGPPIDLSLTGIGPIFQADVVIGEEHTVLSHQYSVKPQEGGYKVEYSVGLRIRMATSKVREAINYEYRDVSVVGTILAKEGEKVVISKNGDRELSLTLGKAK